MPKGEKPPAPMAVAFVVSSTGELHCLLPILQLAKEVEPELRIVVVFSDRRTRALLAQDPIYSAVLAELGAELIQQRELLGTVLPQRHRVRLIFKDFGPTPEGSPPTVLKRLCPNASLILFPHAYGLHSTGQGPAAAESPITAARYEHDLIDLLLVNSELDIEAWSKRLPAEKTRVVGATGYTDWWNGILRRHAGAPLASITEQTGASRIVFLATRGPHDWFLTPENYRYLVAQAVEAVLSHSDLVLIVKPHPREDAAALERLLAAYPRQRVHLSALNTLALASISAVTIGFWSSALLDSLAAGAPTIEFHRYHRPIPMGVLDADGNVASVYTTLGLSLKADSRQALSKALEAALSERQALLERQRAVFDRCFPDNEARLDVLRALLRESLRRPARRASARSVAISALRLAKLSAVDTWNELRDRHGR